MKHLQTVGLEIFCRFHFIGKNALWQHFFRAINAACQHFSRANLPHRAPGYENSALECNFFAKFSYAYNHNVSLNSVVEESVAEYLSTRQD